MHLRSRHLLVLILILSCQSENGKSCVTGDQNERVNLKAGLPGVTVCAAIHYPR
jgi:hypothetical protein